MKRASEGFGQGFVERLGGASRRGALRAICGGAAVSALLIACSPPPPPPAPAIDARAIALLQERETALDQPARVMFDWSINEGGARFTGRGVARVEPPYKARLDLFLGNGELVAQSALVGDELRLPPGAPEGLIPPAPLLWASFGVFKPGQIPRLLGGEATAENTVRLRYDIPGARELFFWLEDGRISAAEILRDGRTEERVQVSWPESPEHPSVANYRNVTAFRELEVEVESIEYVESFPPEIWSLRD